jgi:hypothetical protein
VGTQKVPLVALDVMRDTDTGAIQVADAPALAAMSAAKLISTTYSGGTEVTAQAATPVALGATGTYKKIVVRPRLNDDGTPKNTKIVYIRQNNTNTAAGIQVAPSDGPIVFQHVDPATLFIKSLVNGEGVWVALFA